MLRRSMALCGGQRKWWQEAPPNFTRANRRRMQLERRRLRDGTMVVPPVEPTADMARGLYRRMLKEGYKSLVCTDKGYYRLKLRHEFEVTARQTSGRVRGIMFEKGEWMLQHKLGGLV